jgi:hypothetical protein
VAVDLRSVGTVPMTPRRNGGRFLIETGPVRPAPRGVVLVEAGDVSWSARSSPAARRGASWSARCRVDHRLLVETETGTGTGRAATGTTSWWPVDESGPVPVSLSWSGEIVRQTRPGAVREGSPDRFPNRPSGRRPVYELCIKIFI